MGLIAEERGDAKAARAADERSLAVDASRTLPRYRLALLKLRDGEAAAAAALLEEVVAKDVLLEGAAYNLALAFEKAGTPRRPKPGADVSACFANRRRRSTHAAEDCGLTPTRRPPSSRWHAPSLGSEPLRKLSEVIAVISRRPPSTVRRVSKLRRFSSASAISRMPAAS
jgi:hypothetical protein